MKFIHISDLHIGKRVNGFSMIEDQKYILNKISEIIKEEAPDAVLIAGDVYDKSVASAEAIIAFDEFITSLRREKGLDVFVISGNHDSGERLSFGSRIMQKEGVFLSGMYDGAVRKVVYSDGEIEWGNFGDGVSTDETDIKASTGLRTVIHCLPFIRPAEVRQYFPEEEIRDYNDAVRVAVENMDIKPEDINILVAHQFITGGRTSESEEYSVGGLDNVDVNVFDAFDYVALGHLHGPQRIGRETVRYAGSPLKYSFSEVNQRKSVTVVEYDESKTKAKPELRIREVPIEPLRDLRIIEGRYDEIMSRDSHKDENNDDYIKLVLTDEENIPYVMDKARTVYPNIMMLTYKNGRTSYTSQEAQCEAPASGQLSPLQLFEDFYKRQNNSDMSDEKRGFIKGLIEKVWEEEE